MLEVIHRDSLARGEGAVGAGNPRQKSGGVQGDSTRRGEFLHFLFKPIPKLVSLDLEVVLRLQV